MSTINLGRVRGTMWYTGSGITGTSTTPAVFSGSGVTQAYVGDMYMHTGATYKGNVYQCTTAGDASTAEWAYLTAIVGSMPELADNLTTASATVALSAKQGKILNEMIQQLGGMPYMVKPRTVETSYLLTIEIDDVDTTITLTDMDGNTGTYEYEGTSSGSPVTKNITIGTGIGFAQAGAVIDLIRSSSAQIYGYALYDNDSNELWSDEPNLWEHVVEVEQEIEPDAQLTETYGNDSASYISAQLRKWFDGSMNLLYPITHAKAVWWNKLAGKTLYEKITEIVNSITSLTSTANGSIKNVTVSGKTLTFTKNDNTTFTRTTQDTTYSNATTSTAGLMSAADKTKLDGIASNADNVSFTRSLSSGTKIGTLTINGTGTDLYSTNNTTYSNASTSTAGLMSAADKTKLDGIATGATKNTAAATTSAAGLMSASDKTKLDGITSGANVVAYENKSTSLAITANSTANKTFSVAKSGYTFVGVGGCSLDGTGLSRVNVYSVSPNSVNSELYFAARNDNSSDVTITFSFRCIYRK